MSRRGLLRDSRLLVAISKYQVMYLGYLLYSARISLLRLGCGQRNQPSFAKPLRAREPSAALNAYRRAIADNVVLHAIARHVFTELININIYIHKLTLNQSRL